MKPSDYFTTHLPHKCHVHSSHSIIVNAVNKEAAINSGC